MKSLISLITLACVLVACENQAAQSPQNSSPNIIFVFIDDMGYGDLPLYGNAGVRTPNIDKLGEEGIRFNQFYVNSPICSPSRVAVTTGQYPLRWRITSFLADSTRNENRDMAHYLDPSAPSLARILQDAGYYTAHVGKWHMGGQRNVEGAPFISEFGFNSSLTSFEGLGERLGIEFETKKWKGSNRFFHSVIQAELGQGDIRWVKRHEQPRIYVDRTLEEIQKAVDADQPFYINLWPDAVHTPLEAPPALRGNGSMRAHYYGVIHELDAQLGRLFDEIRSNPQLRDNTFIVFTSDNGPSHEIGSSGGLRAYKGSLYEGGIREPFIVWGPGFINEMIEGSVNDETILAGMDLPPSLLAIAGVETPDTVQFDGLNMSEVFLGRSSEKRTQPIMWVHPPEPQGPPGKEWKGLTDRKELAIRDGELKLLVNTDGSEAELYNIDRNPGETINVIEDHPDIAADLQEQVINWFDETYPESSNPNNPWKKESGK